MAKTALDYSQQIRAQLKILDPDISADPLTPERKIIDTVSEVLADTQIDQYVLNYQFDVDTKVGVDLDQFVALFGFGRQSGNRASGTVTFSRATPATADIYIDAGTQVIKPATSVSIPVIFFTTASAVIPTGGTSVTVPIQAANVGPLGNVPAGTITQLGGSANTDISSVINDIGTSGGVDEESDAALRLRFKNTIFRNISGTKDQFLALAISSQFANKANIIGPMSRYSEWVQVPSTGTIISQIPFSGYTYNQDYYLTDGDPTLETFYTRNGVDYTFTASVPPTIAVNAASTTLSGSTTLPLATITVASTTGFPSSGIINISGQAISYTGKTGTTFTGCTGGTGTFVAGTTVTYGRLLPGTVALFEHTYCSINSRNDPTNNVLNYVDVYVSGQDVTTANEVVHMGDSTFNFNNTSSSAYYVGKFQRVLTGEAPSIGNRFLELLWQPIVSLPSSLTINGNTYYQGTDYWLVRDITNYRQSRRSRDGIEWKAGAASSIGNGTEFALSYVFDKLPLLLNELMDNHKQVTTDVLVHSANERYFNVSLIVMYAPGFSKTSVDEAISTAIEAFFNSLFFAATIQISDLIDVVHNVPGVDNVRLAVPADGTSYGIQEVALDGSTPLGTPKTNDFILNDIDLPVLNNVFAYQRSQNTWSG